VPAACKRNPGSLAITEEQQAWKAARDEQIGRCYIALRQGGLACATIAQ
jgi:hypothetical protein